MVNFLSLEELQDVSIKDNTDVIKIFVVRHGFCELHVNV